VNKAMKNKVYQATNEYMRSIGVRNWKINTKSGLNKGWTFTLVPYPERNAIVFTDTFFGPSSEKSRFIYELHGGYDALVKHINTEMYIYNAAA
jgi:hypothetical protein